MFCELEPLLRAQGLGLNVSVALHWHSVHDAEVGTKGACDVGSTWQGYGLITHQTPCRV